MTSDAIIHSWTAVPAKPHLHLRRRVDFAPSRARPTLRWPASISLFRDAGATSFIPYPAPAPRT
jgi:hypothetical protein